MNIKSLTLFGCGIAVFLLIAMMANAPGIEKGADAIGNAVGDSIDDAARQQQEQEIREIDWQIANGALATFWVNNQRIPTNDHVVAQHGAEGVLAIHCYNDHGAFFIQANKSGDWYFHCMEEDNKTVRTTYWKKDGNNFHLKSAYTKGDGAWSWSQIRAYFENTWRATKATFPSNGTLYVDGAPAPWAP